MFPYIIIIEIDRRARLHLGLRRAVVHGPAQRVRGQLLVQPVELFVGAYFPNGRPDDWRAAIAVAVTGFAGVFLLPFLKYPANPPAVGDPDTIGRRTALYLVAVAWSLLAAWGGWRAWRAFVARDMPVHRAVPATLAVWGVETMPAPRGKRILVAEQPA